MKVFYKKTVSEEILRQVAEALRNGKVIDKFVLTHEEWIGLRDEHPSLLAGLQFATSVTFMGVRLEKER